MNIYCKIKYAYPSHVKRRYRLKLLALASLLFTLVSWIIAANVIHGRLVIDLISPTADVAQVFYSSRAVWSEDHSVTRPTHIGANRLSFPIARGMGAFVRFDPGANTVAYKIVKAYWEIGIFKCKVPLTSLTGLNPLEQVKHSENVTEVASSDADPQVRILAPGKFWRVKSAALFASPLIVGGLLLFTLIITGRMSPESIATYLVGFALCYFLFAMLEIGVWLPDFDDLRYIGVGPPRSSFLNGGYDWLYAVGNDSIAFVGTFLDYVTLRVTNFDFGALRLMALALLVGYLFLQLNIIKSVLKRAPFVCAIGVAAMLLSLGTTSYWGTTAIAYQQFLPVFFGTAIIYLLVNESSKRLSGKRIVLSSILSVLACLSYISGPLIIGAIAVSIIFVKARSIKEGKFDSHTILAIVLGCISTVLLVSSVLLLAKTEGPLVSHNHAVASVYPDDLRFWIFFSAQFGKAIGYLGQYTPIDALVVLFFLTPFFVAIPVCIARLKSNADTDFDSSLFLIVFAGTCAVLYTAAVSFGRAGFIPAGADKGLATSIAKARFHYWWIASFVPYFLVGWATMCRDFAHRHPFTARIVFVGVTVAILSPKSLVGWDYGAALRPEQDRVAAGAYCAIENSRPQLALSQRSFTCPDITGVEIPLGPVMENIRLRKLKVYEDMVDNGFATR